MNDRHVPTYLAILQDFIWSFEETEKALCCIPTITGYSWTKSPFSVSGVPIATLRFILLAASFHYPSLLNTSLATGILPLCILQLLIKSSPPPLWFQKLTSPCRQNFHSYNFLYHHKCLFGAALSSLPVPHRSQCFCLLKFSVWLPSSGLTVVRQLQPTYRSSNPTASDTQGTQVFSLLFSKKLQHTSFLLSFQ